EHDRGIQRSHIAMENPLGGSLVLHVSIAANDFATFVGTGDRKPLVKIFTEEKRVDFRCVPSQRNVLIVIGKDLCLDEVARWKQLGDGTGCADFVEGIAK